MASRAFSVKRSNFMALVVSPCLQTSYLVCYYTTLSDSLQEDLSGSLSKLGREGRNCRLCWEEGLWYNGRAVSLFSAGGGERGAQVSQVNQLVSNHSPTMRRQDEVSAEAPNGTTEVAALPQALQGDEARVAS